MQTGSWAPPSAVSYCTEQQLRFSVPRSYVAMENRLSARPDVRTAPSERVSQFLTVLGLFAASNADKFRLARSFDGSSRIAFSNEARTISAGNWSFAWAIAIHSETSLITAGEPLLLSALSHSFRHSSK